MRARRASIVRRGIILLLALAIPAGIAWGMHSLDHLVSTGLLQDDMIEVASECTLLSSCESANCTVAPGFSNFAIPPLISSPDVPALAGSQCVELLLVFPPNPFSARSHRPG